MNKVIGKIIVFSLKNREVIFSINEVLKFEIYDTQVDHIVKPLPGILRPKIGYKIKFPNLIFFR